MIETYHSQSGHSFTSLPLAPVEIYTDSDMEGLYIGNTVTAVTGERFTILDSKNIHDRTYRLLLLPVAQEVA
ncbi:hypothetical protein KP004_01335 [Geomonas oryzisoli]|uniref:Uncharacterized protein n=1 Tax=Geomonas oryzisoli TaxID=2847992 RepID=A0ABX8J9Q5_9BACT|nr:hypothetical protein [Geomonas oryzisoli]QWV93866.1 hypothetical protein KP004_01335 [Geomonas oryzisoli]